MMMMMMMKSRMITKVEVAQVKKKTMSGSNSYVPGSSFVKISDAVLMGSATRGVWRYNVAYLLMETHATGVQNDH